MANFTWTACTLSNNKLRIWPADEVLPAAYEIRIIRAVRLYDNQNTIEPITLVTKFKNKYDIDKERADNMAQYTPTLYLNESPVELQYLTMDIFPINQGETASYKFDVYLGAFIDSETPEVWIAFNPEYYDYYVVDAFSSNQDDLRYVPCEIEVEGKL